MPITNRIFGQRVHQLSTCGMMFVAAGLCAGIPVSANGQFAGVHSGVVNTDDGVLREAVGDRAVRLRQMELQPFDAGLWTKVGPWVGGEALGPAATDGKVVLIASWASWNSTATRSLALVDRIAKQHASAGLVVMGLHHEQGWEAAEQTAAKLSFPTAHDATGAWRAALDIDQDPDFYVIDRSGQMRYADIRTESVAAAVEKLLAETPAEAASTRDRIAEAGDEAERKFRSTRQLERQVDLNNLPAVPFVMPGPEAYAEVDWPVSVELKKDQGGFNSGEEPQPEKLSFEGRPAFPALPTGTQGKLTVAFMWNHDMPMSLGREIIQQLMPRMNELQRAYGRDVVVVGLLTPFVDANNQQQQNNNDEDRWNIEKIRPKLAEYHRFHNLRYSLVLDDEDRTLQNIMRSPVNTQSGNTEVFFWPTATIVSSDGLARWAGYIGPEFRATDEVAGYDDFILALRRMIERDPGVQARRQAEEAFIRAREGQ